MASCPHDIMSSCPHILKSAYLWNLLLNIRRDALVDASNFIFGKNRLEFFCLHRDEWNSLRRLVCVLQEGLKGALNPLQRIKNWVCSVNI